MIVMKKFNKKTIAIAIGITLIVTTMVWDLVLRIKDHSNIKGGSVSVNTINKDTINDNKNLVNYICLDCGKLKKVNEEKELMEYQTLKYIGCDTCYSSVMIPEEEYDKYDCGNLDNRESYVDENGHTCTISNYMILHNLPVFCEECNSSNWMVDTNIVRTDFTQGNNVTTNDLTNGVVYSESTQQPLTEIFDYTPLPIISQKYYECGICGEYVNKYYKLENGLVIRLNIHSNESRLYEFDDKCEIECIPCYEKSMQNNRSLAYILNAYKGINVEGAYFCINCGQVFGSLRDNRKELACPECGNSYSNKLSRDESPFGLLFDRENYLYQ